MRYTVLFASSRYMEVLDEFVEDPERHFPEGVARWLGMTVEAVDPEEALLLACERLGWPDVERNLIPYGIDSELQLRARIERKRTHDIMLAFWAKHGHAAERLLANLAPPPPPHR